MKIKKYNIAFFFTFTLSDAFSQNTYPPPPFNSGKEAELVPIDNWMPYLLFISIVFAFYFIKKITNTIRIQ